MTEQMRKNDRVIRKTQREVERERTDLERQEKKLVSNNSALANFQWSADNARQSLINHSEMCNVLNSWLVHTR